MDNTAYHKVLPEDTPKGNWTKVRMIEACKKYKLPVNEKELRPVIWARLQTYSLANVFPFVVSLAHERGHEVVYTPPYHSDLQPIEMVWTYTKGRVGRQYCNNTTFQYVKDRLTHEFATLPGKIISDCVNHTNKKVTTMFADLQAIDVADEVTGHDLELDEEDEDYLSDDKIALEAYGVQH
ncbi:hypothetical protein ACHHYP_11409 [Achlya hypogyna]|uniref:Tc1-like transposase DDE domain-containing protein n=1 Tax=Achlya hypogyna TaxID=1202772 RepID=A0A1V9YJ73_ACHHY|nr:hypothetical protein ACHHYP_11409 [Achlya hypogyna]